MRDIIYECDVTEYNILPNEENNINEFCLRNESLIISLKKDDDNYIQQTEIDKESAVELAKLILLKYT